MMDEQREVEQDLQERLGFRIVSDGAEFPTTKYFREVTFPGDGPAIRFPLIAPEEALPLWKELVSTTLKLLREREQQGWIISDGSGTKFRIWDGGIPDWTDDPHKALRMARREDAEAIAAEDEDAWGIYPLSKFPLPTPPEEVKR